MIFFFFFRNDILLFSLLVELQPNSMSNSTSPIAVTKSAGSPSTVSGNSSIPWVEKYRPKTMSEILGNGETMSRLQTIAREGNLPHLLLCGPPGTGKTTSMLCLAHDLLSNAEGDANASVGGSTPPFKLGDAVLELNASDERGIDVVREKIKLFAQTKKTLPKKTLVGTDGVVREVPLHKIVLLDEADSMTPAAQQALRRTMELYSSTTRFAFACNNSTKVIEPIQSRCIVVRFKRLTEKEILQRLLFIARHESVDYTDDGLEALIYLAEGDLRHAVNAMQATHSGYGKITAENVFQVCDQPHPILIERILAACLLQKDLTVAHKEMKRLLNRGFSPEGVMGTFYKVTQSDKGRLFRQEWQQLKVMKVMAEATLRIAEGVGSQLQLAAMLSKIIQIAVEEPGQNP